VKNHDEILVQNSPLLPSTSAPLPCIDSSEKCIDQLTQRAIANSSELVTLDEQIALIDKRLALAGKRIEHTSKKRWTNYISLDPLRIAANVLGGGDVQRDNLAIADLEVKSAELEAYRANLHRRKAEVKSQLRDEVLSLVLKYEAAEREYVLAQSKLATYSQQRQLIEIDYQFGNGSTTQMLSMWQQGESLEAEVIQIESKKTEITRKIQQLTAQSPQNIPPMLGVTGAGETRGR
jgi:predicted ATPase